MDRTSEREGSSIEARKRKLRREWIARRGAVPADRARRIGEQISTHVAALDEFLAARHVALYAASGGEPDLRNLFELGRGAGKIMLLPRCAENRRLTFHVVTNWDELTPGQHGILEPASALRSIDPSAIELALIPAVAVDERGGRLGRGGGFYDRTFPAATPAATAGGPFLMAVVHAFQLVDRVPSGPLDRVVDAVATERGVCRVGG